MSSKPRPKPVPAPKLRFKQFEVQGEWKEVSLRDVLTESRISAQDELGKRLTVSLHLKGVSVRSDRDDADIGKTTYFKRKAGQFIFGKQNIFRGSLGVVPESLDGYLSSQDLPAFDVSDKYDAYFLYNYFARPEYYTSLESLATGSGSKRVHAETIYSLNLAFPGLSEQIHIAACLSSLDAVITAHSDKLEALHQHKRGLMQQLFPAEGEHVPRRRFPEFAGAGEWEEGTVGAVSKTFSGGTPSTSNAKHYGGEIPFIRSAEIKDESTEIFITEEGLKNSSAKLVEKGDLLMALYGANSGDVGISRIDGAINQAILCIRPKISTVFLFAFLEHNKGKILSLYLQGGQGNLSAEIVKSIKLLYPKEKEQTRIAACLSSLDDLISAQAAKVAALQRFKRGLMQRLFPREVVE